LESLSLGFGSDVSTFVGERSGLDMELSIVNESVKFIKGIHIGTERTQDDGRLTVPAVLAILGDSLEKPDL
jgi:hypothetical protein